jgi:predicted kinase
LEKIYSRAVTERVYKKMIGDGLKLLKKGELVILDATFPTDFYRKIVIDKAEKEKIPHLFVECRASEKKTLERLQERIKKKEISDATVQVYLQLKGKFEKIKLPKENYISIDTEKEDVNNEANKVLKKVLCLK